MSDFLLAFLMTDSEIETLEDFQLNLLRDLINLEAFQHSEF